MSRGSSISNVVCITSASERNVNPELEYIKSVSERTVKVMKHTS